MKRSQLLFTTLFSISILTIGCDKLKKNEIIHETVDKSYVLIRDVETLQSSDDEISLKIDSILQGHVQEEFVSTGYKGLDIDGDGRFDLSFEIIDLMPFNNNNLPESFDSLAARVVSHNVEIIDNSTFGYPDALNRNDQIDVNEKWSSRASFVLGTFANAGNFNGEGEKYLGFRMSEGGDYKYGWVKLYCSQHNDTLKIMDFAYNKSLNKKIKAGQID